MTTLNESIGAAYRRVRRRLHCRWLSFQLGRKLKELHYLTLQRAADEFNEAVLLSEIRELQARLEGAPIDLPAVSSSIT